MKLLATDYDGTLRYAQDVMPEDLKSIEEWKNKGNKFGQNSKNARQIKYAIDNEERIK